MSCAIYTSNLNFNIHQGIVNTLVGASVVIITMISLISYKLMLAALIPMPFPPFLHNKIPASPEDVFRAREFPPTIQKSLHPCFIPLF